MFKLDSRGEIMRVLLTYICVGGYVYARKSVLIPWT